MPQTHPPLLKMIPELKSSLPSAGAGQAGRAPGGGGGSVEGDGGLQAGGSPGHLKVLLWRGSSMGWAGQRWHPSAYTDPSERAKLLRGSASAPFPVGLGALLRVVRGL